MEKQTDILIVGAGSGGFGAAYRAALMAPTAHITVVERMDSFGGNATNGGVNTWEPGIAGLGVHRLLYERLRGQTAAIAIGRTTHHYTPQEPYGFSEIDPAADYESTLRRADCSPDRMRRVHFEPEAMSHEMEDMLREAGNVHVVYGCELVEVRTEGRVVQAVVLRDVNTGERIVYRAKQFIDCSGGIVLCKLAGCRTAYGEESEAAYGEPSAPETPHPVVNGVTLMARATALGATGGGEGLNLEVDATLKSEAERWMERKRPVQINRYPSGDLSLNILPVMDGNDFVSLPYGQAMEICRARVIAYWAWFRAEIGYAEYRLSHLFPLAGIRETDRLVGRVVLREQDVRLGLAPAAGRGEMIAYGDHALDTHGRTHVKGGNLRELSQPYGVPFGALLAAEYDNLLAATRGASFTHIAASSCRLSRTMMDLGEAAGAAAALALNLGTEAADVPAKHIRDALNIPDYEAYIAREWNLDGEKERVL